MKYWLFALLLPFSSPTWAQTVLADVTQPLVAITVGFSGAEAMVFGMLDAYDNDVIVVLRGPDQTINLRRKERILGLWLNGPAQRFTQVPGFYGLAASKPVTSLLPLEELKQNRIGLPALQNSLEPARTGDAPRDLERDQAAVIAELARHGLIVQKAEPIRLLGGRLFKVSFALPSNVPVGPFQVTVFAVKDRQIVGAMTTPLITSQIGLAADIHDWAHKLPWAYAFAALGLAILMGGLGFWTFRPR